MAPPPSTSTPIRKHRRLVKTGVDCYNPHNTQRRPRVVQALVQNSVSSTTISSVLSPHLEDKEEPKQSAPHNHLRQMIVVGIACREQ